MLNKIKTDCLKLFKNGFYQKSLVIRTDFSNYNRHFKLWHPRYYDVARRTEYEHKKRDYKNLVFNTMDPLHFDYNMTPIDGGFPRYLEQVKAERPEKMNMSVYRVIYLNFHMAKNKIFDNEFFDELDNLVTPSICNSAYLQTRQIYGALYGYYTFNRGKPENIMFFEHALEEKPEVLHCEMSSILFELAHSTTLMDTERLDLLITNFFKPNFLTNWDKQVLHKQRMVTELFRIFQKVNYLDGDVWKKLIETTGKLPRIQNLNNYHTMLNSLIWYNNNPQSPKFQKLEKEIDKFKNRVRQNENTFWRYDVENARWRTYDELLQTREDIDETYHLTFVEEVVKKEDKKIVQDKIGFTEAEIKKMILDKINKKTNIIQIKSELNNMRVDTEISDKLLLDIAKENQAKAVDTLKKKGQFSPDMSYEKIIESREKEKLASIAEKETKAKQEATKKKK